MSRDGRTVDHPSLEKIRYEALERIASGERPSHVIASYGMCRTTVYKWIRAAANGGGARETLASTIATGRPRILSIAQEQALLASLSGTTPAHYGMPGQLWTRQLVAKLISSEIDMNLGVTAVGKLLARLFSGAGPPPFRLAADAPRSLQRWREELYPPLLRKARSRGAQIQYWSYAQAAPSEQGRGHRAISVDAKSAFHVSPLIARLDDEAVVVLISAMVANWSRPLYLLLDNCPEHRSMLLKRYAASAGNMLELHILPFKLSFPPSA